MYEVHTRQHFLTDSARFKTLLAARLEALSLLVHRHHTQLATGDAAQNEAVQQALRQGYQLLLSTF